MTGIIVLAVLVLAVIAALEGSNRRHATGLGNGPDGSWGAEDRDLARSKLDLLALGGTVEPLTRKPLTHQRSLVRITHGLHFGQHRGHHAV
jgi:hypothetical protein